MSKKFSQFTSQDTVSDNDYINITGATNRRIVWSDFLDNIYDRIVTPFIYPTIVSLQEAPLSADEDDPVYVRVEETEYRLYKITNIAPGASDIVLDNGNTATAQTEYRDIGFVVGPEVSEIGALATYDNITGTLLANGPLPSTVGVNFIEFPDSASDGYFRKKNDNTLELLTASQLKINLSLNNVDNTSDLNKPISTATQAALDLKAPLASPALTGTPTAPTAAANTNTEQLATTAFVQGELTDRIQSVATIADLIALTGVSVGQLFSVNEYSSGLGWGGGDFISKSGSAGSDNVVVKFDSTGSAGIYFERVILDGVINADMAGIAANSSTDDKVKYLAALAAAEGRGFLLDRKIWISPIGLADFGVPDNCVVSFGGSGEVELLPHNTSSYTILPVHDVENVTIINPRLNGRKDLNSAVSGEFGMGLSIRACRGKIVVHNPLTDNCWGDGIYVGGLAVQNWCDDVEIYGHKATGCRRQGLSLVSAKRFILDGAEYDSISGTSPAAGIDIEPDSNDDELGFVRIRNVNSKNCQGPGVKFYLGSISGVVDKFFDIQVDGHTDDGSLSGLAIEVIDTAAGNISGKIIINGGVWKNSQTQGFVAQETSAVGAEIVVNEPTIINCNRSGQTAPKYGGPIVVFRDSGSPRTYAIGNVTIKNPSVYITSGAIPTNGLYFVRDEVTSSNVANVKILDPLRVSSSIIRGVLSNNAHVVSDTYRQLVRVVTGNTTLDANYSPIIQYNSGVTGTITLPSGVPAGYPPVVIENIGAGRVQIATAAGGNFVGASVGQVYQSGVFAGNAIRMVPLGSNIWRAEVLGGSWAVV